MNLKEMEKVVENNIGRRLRSSTKPKNVAEKKDSVKKNKKATGVKNKSYLKQEAKKIVNEEVHAKIKFPGKNPLENPLIINKVFELLRLEEIKQCRLVCTKWNDLSKSFVEKMCQIKIGTIAKCSPETFQEFAGNSDLKFRDFKLIPGKRPFPYWSIPSLAKFFEDQRQKMSKLTIDNIMIKPPKRNTNVVDYNFSLDPHIDNDLTHLVINTHWIPIFAVSSEKLMTAQTLSFRNCTIHFVENCRLPPERLEMKHVKAMKNGEKMQVIDVNDHFIIDNLRQLILEDHIRANIFNSRISINLEACDGILENLVLENVIVENLAECKWEIKGKVKLRGIPFLRPSLMQFTELDFGIANLNLDALPHSIEKLTLDKDVGHMDIISSPNFSLPNLKYLQLLTLVGNQATPMLFLSLFTDCQNLKTVKLVNKECLQRLQKVQILKTEWIPRNVESLSLDGRFKTEGNQIQIKRLVIQNYNDLKSLKENLCILKCDHLVIRLHPVDKWYVQKKVQKADELETTEISLTLSKSAYESVTIGPFDVSVIGANKRYFLEQVDVDKQSSRYYMFSNQKGKAITASEFKKLVE